MGLVHEVVEGLCGDGFWNFDERVEGVQNGIILGSVVGSGGTVGELWLFTNSEAVDGEFPEAIIGSFEESQGGGGRNFGEVVSTELNV